MTGRSGSFRRRQHDDVDPEKFTWDEGDVIITRRRDDPEVIRQAEEVEKRLDEARRKIPRSRRQRR